MDRATLKVKPETAARLRDTMPELSTAAGRMLTIDQALVYLLDAWDATQQRGQRYITGPDGISYGPFSDQT